MLKKYFTKFSTFANQENIYYLLAEKLKTEKTRTVEFIIFEKNDSTSFVSSSCLLANTACHVMVEGEREVVNSIRDIHHDHLHLQLLLHLQQLTAVSAQTPPTTRSVLVTRNNIDSCIEIKDTEKIRI